MKHIKNNPPDLCEQSVPFMGWLVACYNKAKYERIFDNPKAKPMRLCGIHANQAKRRGYVVKPIGE